MGRIADALKRAESERRAAIGMPPVPENQSIGMIEPIPAGQGFKPISSTIGEDESPESVAIVDGLSESLVPFYERSSLVTEQYRSLRTRLLSQNPNYEHRIIAITSAVPKEGKSVTSLTLGCVLAEIRHLKVLVVDGDFRRSSLSHLLNQPPGPGLADVLNGETTYEQVIRKTPVPNLMFIPAGSTNGRSPAELLTAASASPTFRRMQNDFHYTIIDTPPATTVTDVGIIGQMCSGVIVIIRLNRTHEAAAKRAVRLLQVNNIPIIGSLLVGRDSLGGRYGYGYGYRYNYYRYYDYIKDGKSKK